MAETLRFDQGNYRVTEFDWFSEDHEEFWIELDGDWEHGSIVRGYTREQAEQVRDYLTRMLEETQGE